MHNRNTVDILIFGGAFDPPHVGHTTVIKEVLEQNAASQVIIVPVGHHPFNKNLSPAQDRVTMTELAFSDLLVQFPQRISISRYEVDRSKVSYSFYTAQAIQNQNPGKRIGFLIGSDNVAGFGEWAYGLELLSVAKILIYPRVGFPIKEEFLESGMSMLENVSLVKCSSTEIRRSFKDKKPVGKDVLHPKVKAYIHKNLLVEYSADTNEQ